MKPKCYIAGKITGLPEKEVKAKFDAAKLKVIELGYEPVSPIDLPHNHDKEWESYMREALIAMLGCDAIYLCSDFSESRGARVEFNLALTLKYHVLSYR